MALVRLYEATGDDKYLNLSRFFVDQRGTRPYYFDAEHPEAVKKAMRMSCAISTTRPTCLSGNRMKP